MTLEKLQAELAALPDESVAERAKALLLLEAAAVSQKRQTLLGRIATARAARSGLAEVSPQLVDLTTWRDHEVAWREKLCAELLACSQRPRTDHDAGVRQNLTLSILTLDRGRGVFDGSGWELETLRLGQLMREAGYVEAPPVEGQAVGRLPWLGSLPEVEQRLRELTNRRDDVQARLDAALRDE